MALGKRVLGVVALTCVLLWTWSRFELSVGDADADLPPDLLTYVHAAGEVVQGGDPYAYEPSAEADAPGAVTRPPYVYPPTSWPLLRALAWAPEGALGDGWVLGQLLAVVAMGAALAGWSGRPAVGLLALAVAPIGFGRALYFDVASGNLAAFETGAFVLGATPWVTAGVAWPFAAAVVLTAAAKPLNLALLGVPFVFGGARGRRAALGAVALYAVGASVSIVAAPDAWSRWRRVAGMAKAADPGWYNLGLLARVRWVAEGEPSVADPPSVGSWLVYGAVIALLLAPVVAVAWSRRETLRAPATARERAIAFAAGTCGLIAVLPRMMDYSFVWAVPAAGVLLVEGRTPRPARAAALVLVATHGFALQPWVAAVALAGLGAWELLGGAAARPPEGRPGPT